MSQILDCGHAPSPHESFTTGYGIDADGRKHCYACCAEQDRKRMIETGRVTLYLGYDESESRGYYVIGAHTSRAWFASREDAEKEARRGGGRVEADVLRTWHVSNWPGSLRFKVGGAIRHGRHNIAGTRRDVWFTGPDGAPWHGVQYGDNTQLCYCKRVKNA